MTPFMQDEKEGLGKIRAINNQLMDLEQALYNLLNDVEDCKFTTTFFIKNRSEFERMINTHRDVANLIQRLQNYM